MDNQYETDSSRVKITATAKGNQVEISIAAQSVAPDENVEASYRRIRHIIDATGQSELSDDLEVIGKHIGHLRSLVPDVRAAAALVNELHLQVAAQHEMDGGIITYDLDNKLLAAWVEKEHAKIGANIQARIDEDGDAKDT